MSQFSLASQRVIEAFAASMEIAIELSPDSTYGFEFEQSGTLSLVPSQDGLRILVFLARPPYRLDADSHMRFLQLAGFDSNLGTMLHAAIGENGAFVLSASIEESEFSVQQLELIVFTLTQIFSRKVIEVYE